MALVPAPQLNFDSAPRLDVVVSSLREQGWALISDLFDDSFFRVLREEAVQLYEQDEFRRGRVGPTDEELLRLDVRRDSIYWFDQTPQTQAQKLTSQVVSSLMETLNKKLFFSLCSYEAHYAVYPNGGFYKKHVDQFKADCLRQLSFVIYLNEDWSEDKGGQLRIYNEKDPTHIDAEILPRMGTAVLFLSSTIYHEVLPTQSPRMSVAGWMKKQIFSPTAGS